jgi:hypothetical protein
VIICTTISRSSFDLPRDFKPSGVETHTPVLVVILVILFETAPARLQWSPAISIGTLFIEPGTPRKYGNVESFNARMLDELLDREIFYTVKEAMYLIEIWRWEYNHVRPHSSLDYQPPAPAAWIAVQEPFQAASLT